MVKLYYTPTSCGAANFIAAFAAGVSIESETVNIGTHVKSERKCPFWCRFLHNQSERKRPFYPFR